MSTEFGAWMAAVQAQVESALGRHLPASASIPSRLHEAMRYATLGGGKRVRPLLVFAAGDVSGASRVELESAAAAIEMIHVYSLVHDDLPCMDDDVLRRGRATCHIEYDEPTALLVGDALQTRAFEVLASTPVNDPARVLRMVTLLAHAAGSLGMAGGQAIDLAAVGKALTVPELELMHAMKTGALIRAAVLLGALCGSGVGEAEYESLDRFSRRAGLLFQVVDDILDCTASTATLGKTAGKDMANDKPTYVSLLGLARAREFAVELRSESLLALDALGSRAQRLGELCDFIANRQF